MVFHRINRNLLLGIFCFTLAIPLILSSQFTTTTESDFNEGSYNWTFFNSSGGFVQLNSSIPEDSRELPDNGDFAYWANMTGNVLLMHLNEGSGASSFEDTSGSNNDGTCSDCPSSTTGKLNNAFNFDGTGDNINLGLINMGSWSEITICAWFTWDGYTLASGAEQTILHNYDADKNSILLRLEPGGDFVELYFTPHYSGSIEFSDLIISDNNWHHICATSDGSTTSAYLDGIKSTFIQQTNFGSAGNSVVDFVIGSRASDNFDGKIDEVTMWNRSLSEEEIQNLYSIQKSNYFGVYTSDIINPGTNLTWNNLTWISSPYGDLPNNNEYENDIINGINMTGNVLLMHLNNGPRGVYQSLDRNIEGSWDVDGAISPFVLKDGDTYKMWYSGSGSSHWRVLYTTSTNGLNWNTPVQALNYGQEGTWDASHVYYLSVIKDNNTYKMWYTGYGSDSHYRILYTTSTDGINWNTPVQSLNYNIETNWDKAHVYGPSVIKDGDTYKMWYSGHDGTNVRVLYTTSTDGINWNTPTQALNYGVEGTWDSKHAYMPSVIKDGDTYKMWYSGHDGTNVRVLYTTSTDGINWNTPSRVLDYGQEGTWDTLHAYTPSVIKDGDTYKMWYSGRDTSNVYRIIYSGGTQFIDSSGNNNDGFISEASYFPRLSSGKTNNSFIFDGSNDYINIADNSALDLTNQMTLSLWIYSINSSGDNALISKWYDGSKRAYFFGFRDNKLRFALSNPTGTAADLDVDLVGPTLSTNNWYHVALTFVAGGNVYVYVNGVQYGPWTKTGAIADNTDPLTIGSYRGTHYFFNGKIDEVAIWNRSLSEEEIQNIYERGLKDLDVLVRSCDDAECVGENWVNLEGATPQNLSVDDNSYFQYKIGFLTDDLSYSPELFNLTIDYSSSSSCFCPGEDQNWVIDLSEYCIISNECNLSNGNLSFTGTGNITISSNITLDNIGALPNNSIGYITSTGRIIQRS